MNRSKIEWTETTWNPITGCKKISIGCKNCYAERMSYRLKAMGQPNYKNGFKVTCHPHLLNRPSKWKKSRLIFVNSMSDLFHEDVPDKFIFDIFHVANKTRWHFFQMLTKRSSRLKKLSSQIQWSQNIWMGVTVESNEYLERIEDLKNTGAKIKFLSFEPLLNSIPELDLNGIDWVIVGGESGPKARPMKKSWVMDIKKKCEESNIPFFFKQWGGVNKKKSGRILDGKTWDEMPFCELPSNNDQLKIPIHNK